MDCVLGFQIQIYLQKDEILEFNSNSIHCLSILYNPIFIFTYLLPLAGKHVFIIILQFQCIFFFIFLKLYSNHNAANHFSLQIKKNKIKSESETKKQTHTHAQNE